ncbi:hypothetical protein RND81_13G027900 [Saponaria officinalis]|uniref:Sphingomyelin phosphodiesterase 4 n=1 Tax=Saponaria officinalis TaxID=3572 RepID=A0AAW1GWU5_SAPOF
MTPHSYSLDSQTKSTELAGKILATATPSQIAAVISTIDSHLTRNSADQNRHFFSLAFPTLISKLFGFSDDVVSSSQKPPSWIYTASLDGDLAGKLFAFLSPRGTLISSIFAVDKLLLVKYVFPVERLPEWFRFTLNCAKDCQILNDLCPLFRGRVKEDAIVKGSYHFQVHLNVFEYFVFWFAYYPVCRGDNDNLGTVSVSSSRKFRLENWTSSIPVLSSGIKRTPEHKDECNLYLRLLYAYLCAFVPMDDLNAHQPFRSSLLHYSPSFDDSVIMRAEFLVSVFVHYWLVDNDVSPLAVNVCKSFGVSFPFRSALGEMPPPSGLGEVVKLFVKYLNLSSVMVTRQDMRTDYVGSSGNKKFTSGDFVKTQEVISWNGHIQRPLYRFILRTFLFCPMGSSMKNISEVFSVWIDYIEPWKLSKEEFSEFDTSKNNIAKENGHLSPLQYSAVWEGYVLSNYLFYTSLVMHFIGFAHKFLHTDAEVIVRMISKVMDILTSSRELLDLIKNADAAFHSQSSLGGKATASSVYKFVPQIREQLQDWEDGLSESDADGSFLHENWNRDLRLFSDGEDGGPQILQLFILRAENELQAISGDNLANNLQCVHSLKSQLHSLFGEHAMSQNPQSPRTIQRQQLRDDLFKPRRVLNGGSVPHVKYTGDWLRRPISDDEVAWLAKILIPLSIWVNESLGLYQTRTEINDTPSYVEVPTDVVREYGVPDSMRAVIVSVTSWFYSMWLAIARVMIKHGLKVNLRVFASKKFVTAVLVFFLFRLLRRAFRSIW